MEPTATAKIVAQAAKELGVVATAYNDLLQPAAQEAGKKLVVVAKAVSIALAPLEASVWGYEKIKEYLSAKVAARLAGTPAEEIKPPPRVIAGPVVMGMVFASEEEHLREMYANLLAAAMHGPTASRAHPSFVQAIQQLSPAEARILQDVAAGKFPPELAKSWVGINASKWPEYCASCGLKDEVLAGAYLDNLRRLGILTEAIRETSWMSVWVQVSDYGRMFLDVCVREPTAARIGKTS